MYLKLKAVLISASSGTEGKYIVSTATEQLAMEKSEARMNGHPPNGSKGGFVKFFSDMRCVD